VALCGRPLLEEALKEALKEALEVGAAILCSVTRAPLLRRLTPYSYKEGKGDGLNGVPGVLARLRLAPPGKAGEVKVGQEADPVAAIRAACLPACLIFCSLFFVGQIILPFLTLGRARQLLWLAL
jgi:hypothetical protein